MRCARSRCGVELRAGARWCQRCGLPVEIEQRRLLETIRQLRPHSHRTAALMNQRLSESAMGRAALGALQNEQSQGLAAQMEQQQRQEFNRDGQGLGLDQLQRAGPTLRQLQEVAERAAHPLLSVRVPPEPEPPASGLRRMFGSVAGALATTVCFGAVVLCMFGYGRQEGRHLLGSPKGESNADSQ